MSDLLRLLLAPLFWLAAFSGVYGLHGLICAPHSDLLARLDVGPAPLVLPAAWVAALAVLTGILAAIYRWPSRSDILQRSSIILGWTSLAAMVWTLFPVLFSPVCA